MDRVSHSSPLPAHRDGVGGVLVLDEALVNKLVSKIGNWKTSSCWTILRCRTCAHWLRSPARLARSRPQPVSRQISSATMGQVTAVAGYSFGTLHPTMLMTAA